MPTLFERARRVIERLLPIAEKLVHEITVDEMVKRRLKALSGGYGGGLLREDRKPIDYTKMTTHIAYLYRSFPAHADWVYKALCLGSQKVVAAFSQDTVTVACIGGGPGSDIAGVMKFAEKNNLLSARYHFMVLDRQPAWEFARRELVDSYGKPFRIKEYFEPLNLAGGEPWADDWAFSKSDLFIFSFVLSEVWCFNKDGSVSQFLDRLINAAKKGALFCYVDNGGTSFTPLAQSEFDSRTDLKRIGSVDDERLLLSYDEQCSVVEDVFRDRFGQRPKLTGNVALRLWAKTK